VLTKNISSYVFKKSKTEGKAVVDYVKDLYKKIIIFERVFQNESGKIVL